MGVLGAGGGIISAECLSSSSSLWQDRDSFADDAPKKIKTHPNWIQAYLILHKGLLFVKLKLKWKRWGFLRTHSLPDPPPPPSSSHDEMRRSTSPVCLLHLNHPPIFLYINSDMKRLTEPSALCPATHQAAHPSMKGLQKKRCQQIHKPT